MEDVTGLVKSAKALEESFFVKENEKLLAKLREEARGRKKRETLREALHIDDDAVLDRLVELDLSPEAIVAFSLVPLVEVAWADGSIQAGERAAILRAAQERGIAAGTVSHRLLESWLRRPPQPALLEVWRHYARALLRSFDPPQRELFRERVVGAARGIAEAAGGFLGLGSISSAERAMLQDLESTFV